LNQFYFVSCGYCALYVCLASNNVRQ